MDEFKLVLECELKVDVFMDECLSEAMQSLLIILIVSDKSFVQAKCLVIKLSVWYVKIVN